MTAASSATRAESIPITECRVCGSSELTRFLDLGFTPLANAFLAQPSEGDEPRYSLDVNRCAVCGHAQLGCALPPEALFRDYVYVSSTSDTLRRHFTGLAEDLLARQQPWSPNDLVVEIASNDGILQREFRRLGARCLGIEPATNIATLAQNQGFEVLNEFFNLETARTIRERYGPARIITGSNVLGHVDQVRDFVAGIAWLLADDGLVCMEVPHLLELLAGTEFDTIYHEHFSYWSLLAMDRLFADAGLTLFDVTPVPVHGGTIRAFARRTAASQPRSASLARLQAAEEAYGIGEAETYQQFADRVEETKRDLLTLLADLRNQNCRIAAYGAAAKGSTLLNYCGIGRETLEYIVDKSPAKQGLFAPGSNLPVLPVERLSEDPPDYLLVLAWNFAEEIIEQQHSYFERGGRFIVPLPQLTVVEPSGAIPRHNR